MTGSVVLVGAGHAHLEVIRRAPTLRSAGIELTVVAPRWFRYSGLASPVAAGLLPPSANTIDVAALARRCGVAHHEATVDAIDLPGRRLRSDDGAWHPYTAVSFNVGSVSRREFTAIGDTINLAKRVQENAAPGQIMLTRATYETLARSGDATTANLRPCAAVQLKGRQQATELYEVI